MSRKSSPLLMLVGALFATAAAAVLSPSSRASSIIVDREDAEGGTLVFGGSQFQIDTSRGAAWLNLVYAQASSGGNSGPPMAKFPVKAQLQGLCYDSNTNRILYISDNYDAVNCANVTFSHGIFGQSKIIIAPTGNCTFHATNTGGPDELGVYMDVADGASH